MKKFLALVLLNFCSIYSFSQSTIEFQLQLLTSDVIAEATLDQDEFIDWVKKLNTEIENYLVNIEGDNDVLILISMHKDKDASIDIGARPKMDKSVIDELLKKVKTHKSPNTKFTDYSFAIMATLNKGCEDQEMDFDPIIVLPEEKILADFKELDLEAKKTDLQNWIKNEVIPILAYYETIVDPKFSGVLNFGKILEKEDYLKSDVESLTDNNSDYWRATMEMSTGNQLIPFSKSCLHIAKGEFDKAQKILFLISYFSDETSLPAKYHEEITGKLDLIYEELNEEINKGIAMHDAEKYKEAVAHYEKLLKIFPYSAWLNYELYYSKTAEINEPKKVDEEWNKSKKIVYSCDPMYPLNVRAKTGKEGYLLFRRSEINTLFKSKKNLKTDFVKYADIAFELENYGFAAQLYWLILTYLSKEDYENRNILAYYLYCLDKLGDKESIKNFKGNFPKEFKKIEKERQKIMEKSDIYNAFEKKD